MRASVTLAGHRARKRFGQHFLVDRGVIERVLSAIAPVVGDRIVEIGPGHGALTQLLLARVDSLDVVEIDRDLAGALAAACPKERLRVHLADALRFNFCALGMGLRVVGNLPYNISTPLLFHLAGQIDCIHDCYFMLQREVVERMAAQPGGHTYGRLSVMIQYRFAVTRLFRVAAGAFRPIPKVESALVRLTPLPPDAPRAKDEKTLAALVAGAFSLRRKTLRNALAAWLTEAQIERAGIDPKVRPETLTVAQFVQLADAVSAAGIRLPAAADAE